MAYSAVMVSPAAGATAIVQRLQHGVDDEQLIWPPTTGCAVG
jgi:hypothetical protein